MKKVYYSVKRYKRNEMIEQKGVGYISDTDLVIACISQNNVMIAIEEGIITSTTKARMTELGNSLAEINMKIAAEESKLDRTLKKKT